VAKECFAFDAYRKNPRQNLQHNNPKTFETIQEVSFQIVIKRLLVQVILSSCHHLIKLP
jgi:hypothetical protein